MSYEIYYGLLKLLIKLLLNRPSSYFPKLVQTIKSQTIFYQVFKLEPANLLEMNFLREILKDFAKL